jgi:DNA (cytosine-5)-methyltransferase 1
MQLIKVKSATSSGYEEATSGDTINLSNPNSETRRGRVGKQKAQTLETSCNQAVVDGYRIRRLTPIECERLQGFQDQHTAYGNYDGEVKPMSNSQRYKQCGNAVTVDVVAAVAKKCIPLFN